MNQQPSITNNKEPMHPSSSSTSTSTTTSSQTPLSTSSIILSNGNINTTILENEIINDISNNAKYYAEDEMKKRAVHQVKDYDEFKNFVKCSQLKPVHSKDMNQLFVHKKKMMNNGVDSDSGNGSSNSYKNQYDENDVTSTSKLTSSMFSSSLGMNRVCSNHQTIEKRMKKLQLDIPDNVNDIIIDKSNNHHNQNNNNNNHNNNKNNDLIFESLFNNNNNNSNNKTMDQIIMEKEQVLVRQQKQSTIIKKHKKKKQTSQSHFHNYGPKNAMEFEKEWNLYRHSSYHIMKYLTLSYDDQIQEAVAMVNNMVDPLDIPNQLRIVPEYISQSIFKVEINPIILGEIIEALEHYLQSKPTTDETMISFVYRWIKGLSKCGRFELNLDFLTKKQKDCVASILDTLGKHIIDSHDSHGADNKDVTAVFDEESYTHLRLLYKM